jgi:hypothetical protein
MLSPIPTLRPPCLRGSSAVHAYPARAIGACSRACGYSGTPAWRLPWYMRSRPARENRAVAALADAQPGVGVARPLSNAVCPGWRSSTVTIPTRKSGSQETRCWREMDSNPRSPVRRMYANTEIAADREQPDCARRPWQSPQGSQVRKRLAAGGRWIRTCMGLFLSRGCFGFAESSLFGAGKPFFVPSPAISFAERAEGVKGPKR